jgi:lactoylglutathione lyase
MLRNAFCWLAVAALATGLSISAAGIQSAATISKTEKKPMIRSTHLRLLVTDYNAEFRFFRDVLGFQPTFGAEGENYADFDCNGLCIALFKRSLQCEDMKKADQPLAADSEDRVAMIFGVADVDATVTHLKAKGVKFVTEAHDRKDWGIRVAHFRDPNGNLIEINHGLPPSG